MERTKIHSLPTLLFIALCTFLTGGKSFYEMEL
ncbi:MAG: transposase family protein [Desulfovibrio sp.]|nr:transposase family protein [Desulfovibrio sp.]